MNTVAFYIFLTVTFFSSCFVKAQNFSTGISNQGVLIKENDNPVLFYQQVPKSLNGKYQRANYIHPLYGLSQEVLTEDFPEDHPHHRGIFWAWHQLWAGDKRLGNPWLCEDFSWNVTNVTPKQTKEGNMALFTECEWLSPHYTDKNGARVPFAKDMTTILVSPATEQYRIIDFTIVIQAFVPEFYIGGSEDEKGYGGFSVRVKLPEDITFKSLRKTIEPQTLAVKAYPWMDLQGNFVSGKKTKGMTIMVHEDNPYPINDWILRKKNSMQNPVFPGSSKFYIPEFKPLMLKYRLVIHNGFLSTNQLNKIYRQYNR
ncbi:MAG: DUF6807 family protein [Bacteroidota bacterium]